MEHILWTAKAADLQHRCFWKEELLPNNRLRVAVVGGGIGGLSAANALFRRGLDVTVFEQVETLREIGTGLSLFPNGRRQLERMGWNRRARVLKV